MRQSSVCFRTSLAVAVLYQLVLAEDAFAYLDPGTGSYVFQMVAALLLSGAFMIKHYWRGLKAKFARTPPRESGDDAPTS